MPRQYERARLYWDLARAAALDHDARMWFYEVAAVAAAQEATWHERVWVCEGVTTVHLAVKRAAPAWTAERPIESVELPSFSTKDVLEALHSLERDLRV